ncbi:MAG: iron-containing alcohol dehydrogenase [Christensenellales bacterium]
MGYIEYQTNPRYVQCENALSEIRRYTHGMGKNYLIVTACGTITKQVADTIAGSFTSAMESKCNPAFSKTNSKYAANILQAQKYDAQKLSFDYSFVDCEGMMPTKKSIQKLTAVAKERKADVIIGVGGGRGLDLARAVSHDIPCRTVLAPTSPATNASGSALSVVYNEDGSNIEEIMVMPVFPDLVLADLNIMIRTPPVMLAAGIADSLGAAVEALSRAEHTGQKQYMPDGPWYATELIRTILMKNGRAAMESARKGTITREYESVIACICNTCGSVRSARFSFVSHLMDELLLAFEGSHRLMHGLRVGYGTLAQLAYDKKPLDELHAYIDFCVDLGVPVTFEQLGIQNVSYIQLREASARMLKGNTAVSLGFPFAPEDFADSMMKAERIVKDYLKLKK